MVSQEERRKKMKKGKFVAGTIFFVIAVAVFLFGTYLLLDGLINVDTDSAEGLALILIIPLAIFSYSAELVATVISVPCLLSYRRDYEEPAVRTASVVMAIIEIVLMIFAAGLIVYLYASQSIAE